MTEKILPAEELLKAIEEASERAAEHAVEKVLLLLGVDSADRPQITRLRDNLQYLEQRRQNEEEARRVIKNSAATVLTTALIAGLAWALLVFKGGFHDWFNAWLGR